MEITDETPADEGDIERLLDLAFGTDRAGKTVYRLRDGVAPVADLCTIIREDGGLRGSLRFWPITVGDGGEPGLLLGPVAVSPADRGKGYARALIWNGLKRSRELGYRIVLLVGDAAYYGQFGFTRQLTVNLALPGWVDLDRFLGLELAPGALDGISGMVRPASP